MKAYIIVIGDEILSGRTQDTNSRFISNELDNIGIEVDKIITISDNEEIIESEIDKAINNNINFIFTTGGLGPTKDDKTKKVISKLLNDELVFHKLSLEELEKLVIKKGRQLNDLKRNQALVPSKSEIIINKYGTAPIMWSKIKKSILINFPGVPYETENMLVEYVIPKIKSEFNLSYTIRKSITVFNIPESSLAMMIEDWGNNLPKYISLSYLPQKTRIILRLSSKGNDKNLLEKNIFKEIEKLTYILGNKMLMGDLDISNLIHKLLIDSKLTLSVCESITGGNISKNITSFSGSSFYFKGGIIAYDSSVKENIVNVSKNEIAKNVVSREIAFQMAKNVSELLKTDIGISSTGVAGPNTDEYDNPVGLAYIGVNIKGDVTVEKIVYPNVSREIMIENATNKAIEMLYYKLTEYKNN